MNKEDNLQDFHTVIPAKAGMTVPRIRRQTFLDSRFRGNDGSSPEQCHLDLIPVLSVNRYSTRGY
jgi:hypothetical protein